MRVLIAATTAVLLMAGTPLPALAQDTAEKALSPCMAARFALADGDMDEAVDQFTRCLDTEELTPDAEVEAYAGLGAAHLSEDNWSDALSAFNFAFAIAETNGAEITNGGLYRNRGIARAQLDMTDRALDDLLRAAAMMPDDVLTQINLGVIYQQTDRHAQAVVAFDRVVRLEPDWVGGWLNRSGALLEAGMTSDAVADARRAVELEPEDGSTLNMLCWTLIQDGRAEIALPLCEQAVAAEPDIGAIVHSHAAALEALGRLDEALPLYRRAHRLSPEDPEITADYERTHNP